MKSTTVVCPNCGKRNRVPAAADGKPRCANCHHWLPWVVDAGDLDFAEIVEKSAVPVLSICGPRGVGRAGWSARRWNSWPASGQAASNL